MTHLRLTILLVIAAWAFCSRLGAFPLLDDPNEGEYAEVAREMVETGEWISPQLNYVLFLNKPPLTYWLVGVSYLTFGVNEFAARLPVALAAVVIIFLIVQLGSVLFDRDTGLLAGLILLTSGGFFLEAHLLRPDLLQVAAMAGSFLALAHFEPAHQSEPVAGNRKQETEDRPFPTFIGRFPVSCFLSPVFGSPGAPALIGWQIAIAIGLMSKGMVAVLIPGFACVVLSIARRDLVLVRTLLHPRAWWLLLLLIAPWHVIMSLRHQGFLWDYVINQHLLFFFDKKWPRDSVPVSLPVFWMAYAMRLFPWTLFAPLATVAAARRWQRQDWNTTLVLAWLAAALLLFSAAASRMEHYSIPALPPTALLLAKLFRDYRRDGLYDRSIAVHLIAMTAIMMTGIFAVPRIIADQPWLAAVGDFVPMARNVFMILSVGAGIAALLAVGSAQANDLRLQIGKYVAPAIGVSFLCIVPYFLEGLGLVAQVDSSAPLAAELVPLLSPETRVVYEAPIEYQNCAGFNFYLRRKLDLLAHPDFVPPPYLTAHVDELYISRAELNRVWQREPLFLITDPLQERRDVDGILPVPAHVVGHDYSRLLISNREQAAS